MLAGLTVKPEAMRAAARWQCPPPTWPTTSSRRACPSAMRTRWWPMQSRPPARVALTGNLSLDELRAFDGRIENDVFEVLSLEGSLNARSTLGGTAPDAGARAGGMAPQPPCHKARRQTKRRNEKTSVGGEMPAVALRGRGPARPSNPDKQLQRRIAPFRDQPFGPGRFAGTSLPARCWGPRHPREPTRPRRSRLTPPGHPAQRGGLGHRRTELDQIAVRLIDVVGPHGHSNYHRHPSSGAHSSHRCSSCWAHRVTN